MTTAIESPKIYVIGPYISNPIGNQRKAVQLGLYLASQKCTPYIPHSMWFGWEKYSGKAPYPELPFVQWGLNILLICDGAIVFGEYEISKGSQEEIEYCQLINKPYLILPEKTMFHPTNSEAIRQFISKLKEGK